jgi:hypothetical protein
MMNMSSISTKLPSLLRLTSFHAPKIGSQLGSLAKTHLLQNHSATGMTMLTRQFSQLSTISEPKSEKSEQSAKKSSWKPYARNIACLCTAFVAINCLNMKKAYACESDLNPRDVNHAINKICESLNVAIDDHTIEALLDALLMNVNERGRGASGKSLKNLDETLTRLARKPHSASVTEKIQKARTFCSRCEIN